MLAALPQRFSHLADLCLPQRQPLDPIWAAGVQIVRPIREKVSCGFGFVQHIERQFSLHLSGAALGVQDPVQNAEQMFYTLIWPVGREPQMG